jgi:hypothetical protein
LLKLNKYDNISIVVLNDLLNSYIDHKYLIIILKKEMNYLKIFMMKIHNCKIIFLYSNFNFINNSFKAKILNHFIYNFNNELKI